MCPPLGHSSARIGPALLMRRAQRPSCGEVRPTGGSRGQRRLQMGRENMASWEYQSVGGVERVAACTTGCKTKCQTTLCARRWRAFRQGRPCLSFLAVPSALPNLTNFTHQDPVGPKHFRVPDAAANFRPC